jgi:hypothetical protein
LAIPDLEARPLLGTPGLDSRQLRIPITLRRILLVSPRLRKLPPWPLLGLLLELEAIVVLEAFQLALALVVVALLAVGVLSSALALGVLASLLQSALLRRLSPKR